MTQPWLEGVQGTQVVPLINSDKTVVRVEAGPGTGKTYGLVRRVFRILHPDGLGVPAKDVLVVAFNRVIAEQLTDDIGRMLKNTGCEMPTVRTVHALCAQVIGADVRLLLEHEREAMVYDVREAHPIIQDRYPKFKQALQALAEHEAKHQDHPELWQACQQWLCRHNAQLISELPGLLLDRLKGGDFRSSRYAHVVVDEFQDLTPGEQQLFIRLRKPHGSFVALGDTRQSIYRFRGNAPEGLAQLETLLEGSAEKPLDILMTECLRCPAPIVKAANRLMGLYSSSPMVPTSTVAADTHVVVWDTPKREAEGMARALVTSLRCFPNDKHLVMVTRRSFGYWLRDHVATLDPSLKVELNFSESLLETWSVREAFLFFCLRVDPDAPTWRAWLGYKNAPTGKGFAAQDRNAAAYLQFLTSNKDRITQTAVVGLAESPAKPPGKGGTQLWQRARRFVEVLDQFEWDGSDAATLIELVFADTPWITSATEDAFTARLDMGLARIKALAILDEVKAHGKPASAPQCLRQVAQRLRYQVATREPFVPDTASDAQVATLWGAKGVTADRVFILGLCQQAIPGTRRQEYPGTDHDFLEEQRRLFYVSLTRSKKTLVLSRGERMAGTDAVQIGLYRGERPPRWVTLAMSPFLRDIQSFLPDAKAGDDWLAETRG